MGKGADQIIATALNAARKERATGGSASPLDAITNRWSQKGAEVGVSDMRDGLRLNKIVVPKDKRGQGMGSSIMGDLTNHADSVGKRMTLTPSTHFGGSSVGRLVDFYKGHGFTENKGRSRDLSISDSMVREPREKFAAGGGVHVHKPHLHVGPIHSGVAGRTDHLPMHVPSGSYVLPADIVSAHGEGSTIAGFKVLRRMFGGNPYGGHGMPYGATGGPYGEPLPGKANGGEASGVPIVAAGGEYVLSPNQVMFAGNGDLEAGHRALDGFVKQSRAELVKTLSNLPGPKKD